MNILDILIIIFLILWIIRGFVSGFSITITTLMGLVLGIAGAMLLSPYLADMMKDYIKNELVRELIAYFLIFFVITTIFRIIGLLLKNFLKKLKLSDIDGYMGAMVSTVEGVLFTSLIILLMVWGPWDGARNLVGESKMAPVFMYISDVVISNLPEDVQEKIKEKMEQQSVPEKPLEPKSTQPPEKSSEPKHPDYV